MFMSKRKTATAALLLLALTVLAATAMMAQAVPLGHGKSRSQELAQRKDTPKDKATAKDQPGADRDPLDFLPLVQAKDKSKLNDREREILPEILKKLENGKVPTADKAKEAAATYKLKMRDMLAEEAPRVVSLLPLGIDVPDFGQRGDLVWVVQFRLFGHGAITQEVWINANTGGVVAILPLKR